MQMYLLKNVIFSQHVCKTNLFILYDLFSSLLKKKKFNAQLQVSHSCAEKGEFSCSFPDAFKILGTLHWELCCSIILAKSCAVELFLNLWHIEYYLKQDCIRRVSEVTSLKQPQNKCNFYKPY